MMEEELQTQPEFSELKKPFYFFPFSNHMQPMLLLLIIGAVFYFNSIKNEYALDDGIVIHQNSYVVEGLSGIPDILASDTYKSFYERMNATDQLQGGRYRPLAGISFALEQELIHPYRSGFYMRVEDLNHNGVLDKDKVSYTNYAGQMRKNYEYNEYVDVNADGVAQSNECNACWDLNKNFSNDYEEDLNKDGVFNEVDCQVYGAMIRHFNNIWLYILGALLLYILFRDHFFKENQDMAFLGALIYLVHPVHSEVIANVRGREDIFSLIFICLTFIFAFRYMKEKNAFTLIMAGIMLFLALMSKEYGMMMFVLVPLAIHVFLKEKTDPAYFILTTVCFAVLIGLMIAVDLILNNTRSAMLINILIGPILFVVLGITAFSGILRRGGVNALMVSLYGFGILYAVFRLNAVNMAPGVPDTEILNNPFLLANGQEEFATKIYVLFKYFILLWFPHPLVSDYSFNSISYVQLTDKLFIISLFLHLSMLVAGIVLSIKRHVLGFAIICYLLFLLFVSNLFFPTGTMMLENHLFHASIGFAMALAWLIITALSKLPDLNLGGKRIALFVGLLPVLVLFGCKTWERNADWKNDVTLFLKDVKNSPNSVLVLGNAGARWIDLADTKEITGISIPGSDSTSFNDYNGTLHITDEELRSGGYKNKREAALYKGIGYIKHAVELHPRYVNGYLNLGLAYYKLADDKNAVLYWKMAERLYPNNPYLRNYYIVYKNELKNRAVAAWQEGNNKKSRQLYTLYTIVDPEDAEGWYQLGGTYYNESNQKQAERFWEKAVQLNPGHSEAKNALMILRQGRQDVKK